MLVDLPKVRHLKNRKIKCLNFSSYPPQQVHSLQSPLVARSIVFSCETLRQDPVHSFSKDRTMVSNNKGAYACSTTSATHKTVTMSGWHGKRELTPSWQSERIAGHTIALHIAPCLPCSCLSCTVFLALPHLFPPSAPCLRI